MEVVAEGLGCGETWGINTCVRRGRSSLGSPRASFKVLGEWESSCGSQQQLEKGLSRANGCRGLRTGYLYTEEGSLEGGSHFENATERKQLNILMMVPPSRHEVAGK